MKRNNLMYVSMANAMVMENAISNVRKASGVYEANNGSCVICNFIHSIGRTTAGNGHGKTVVITPKYVRGVHVCDYHKNVNHCRFSYSFEYSAVNGKPTDKGISNSIEFETQNCKLQGLVNMVAGYGFCPTEDCTVHVEFKSPIYVSLQGMTKALGGIEDCIRNEFFKVDSSCGTHLHTSVYNGINEAGKPVPEFDYRELAPAGIYEALFFPVCRYFNDMTRTELIGYFGSDFRGYAINPINCRSDYYDGHSYIFNVQHSYSLEFRLPRFHTAVAYRNIVLFMQDLTTSIAEYQRGNKTATEAGRKNLQIAKKYFPVIR